MKIRSRVAATLPTTVPEMKYNPKKGRRKHRPVEVWKVVCGLGLTVVLLLLTGLLDFQKKLLKDECSHDGECRQHTSCAISPTGRGGVCEPIPFHNHELAVHHPADPACWNDCLTELQRDEHHYFQTWPTFEWSETLSSPGHPPGCAVVFRRYPESDQWEDIMQEDSESHWPAVPPSIQEWIQMRSRYIRRVEPFEDDLLWIAVCTEPCHSDLDCASAHDVKASGPGYVCRDGACAKNPEYWRTSDPMVLVTAASANDFSSLVNWAASARYWAPSHSLVIYNTGLTEEQLDAVQQWNNVLAIGWNDGIPNQYPSEGNLTPLIVREAVTQYRKILWIDVGATLTGPVTPAQELLEQEGVFLWKVEGTVKAHDKTLEWLGVKDKSIPISRYSNSVQGYIYPSRYHSTVVVPHSDCALHSDCLVNDARYDETTLSVLASRYQIPHHAEFIATDKSQLSTDLSQPSFKFLWDAHGTCDYYTKLDTTVDKR